jgi:hypothetical protein
MEVVDLVHSQADPEERPRRKTFVVTMMDLPEGSAKLKSEKREKRAAAAVAAAMVVAAVVVARVDQELVRTEEAEEHRFEHSACSDWVQPRHYRAESVEM